jgi:spermidine synthase
LDDPRIHVLRDDGRRFVKNTNCRYDAVLIDVAEPSTSQTNRYYTREFLAELQRVLRPGGVISFSLGEYGEYIGPELGRLVAVAQRTAAAVFAHTLLIPGYRIYLLASDGPLSTDVAARLEARGVPTRFVNRHYLRAALAADRLAALARLIDPTAAVNRDFNPILYFDHLRYWMNQFQVRFELFEGALLALLVVYLTRIRTVTLVLFTTGFAASALEVVLLLGFQILYGCVYHQVGVIVTMFMLGLGIGSWTMNRWLPKRNGRDLVWLVLGLALLAVLLPPLLGGLDHLGGLPGGGWTGPAIVALLALLLAVLVGLIFPLAGKADFQRVTTTAARLYTADYLGSAIGALLVSTLLIPWIGVAAVCWLSAGLSVLSAGVVRLTYRR